MVFTGHAIEARLYAEDPTVDFLPASGTIEAFAPVKDPKVRVDSGVEKGTVVGVDFDALLAKVTAHGKTRAEAAARLTRALECLHLGGPVNNRDFLVAILQHEEFLIGNTTTDFIERQNPMRNIEITDDELLRIARTSAMWIQGLNRKRAQVLRHIPSGWRNARLPDEQVQLSIGSAEITVSYHSQRDGGFLIDGYLNARVHEWSENSIDLEINGIRARHTITATDSRLYVQTQRSTVEVSVLPRFGVPEAQRTEGELIAPMPCKVVEIKVSDGDSVTAGQTLIILEAMKMEHHLKAPHDGTVAKVMVTLNAQVPNGLTLIVLDEDVSEKSVEG